MFTTKDIECRSIFVINCIEEKNLRVQGGELLLEDMIEKKTLTKLPFQKVLALFVIGHITVTTPLIEKCTRYGIPLVVMKPNFRPAFFFSISAEANFLLKQKQYLYDKNDLKIAKVLVKNKILNQLQNLEKTRLKTQQITNSKEFCNTALQEIAEVDDYNALMGIEGSVAKAYFAAYFAELGWKSRTPRAKTDPINSTLDIGYTILFNYIEAFVRLFGFDPYIGVYHRLWYKRKSLICDLMEPFRCIIDHQIRIAFNKKQFKAEDFNIFKNEYVLKREHNSEYTKVFYNALIEYKSEVFVYIRDYYRSFMQNKAAALFPEFKMK